MHILFCVNNIKFGTKCFVKVEQFVLPFIYPGNLIKDVEMVSGPSKISVEGANGSAATDYNMWIVKTAIVNETTNHATLKIS